MKIATRCSNALTMILLASLILLSSASHVRKRAVDGVEGVDGEHSPDPEAMFLHGGVGNGRRLLAGRTSCILLKTDTKLSTGEEEETVSCEMPSASLPDGEEIRIVAVDFLPKDVVDEMESGKTVLTVTDAVMDEIDDKLMIGTGSEFETSHESGNDGELMSASSDDPSSRRQLTVTIGNRRVLVIRETRSGTSASEISDTVFGTGGRDPFNVVSQTAACSYNQVTLSKYTGNSKVNNGVLTVSVPGVFGQITRANFQNAMLNEAQRELGVTNLNSIVDHVMLCVPAGVDNGFVAAANMNHWLSAFRDSVITQSYVQLHELGHNWNLGHSPDHRIGSDSTVMGQGQNSRQDTQMCFNGAKTYQLGWFTQYHVDLSGSSSFTWTGSLVGFAERDALPSGSRDKMIIRIRSTNVGGRDYYVNFNRKIGFNIDSRGPENEVMVVSTNGRDAGTRSEIETSLPSGNHHIVRNFQGTGKLYISVINIGTGVPSRAFVYVHYDGRPTDERYQPYIAMHSDKAIGVEHQSNAPGAVIRQHTFVGLSHQLFYAVPGRGGFRLKVQHSGMCLAARNDSQSNGVDLVQEPCNDREGQLLNWNGMSLVFKVSGKCVDVHALRQNNGGRLTQWTCGGGEHQQFRSERQYIAAHSNRCMSVQHTSTDDGASIIQRSCSLQSDFKFFLEPVDGGFQLKAQHSGKCVGVQDASQENAARVVQQTCWFVRRDHQILNWVGSQLVFKHSGKCLDVSRRSQVDGAVYIQFDCSDTALNQRFSLGQ